MDDIISRLIRVTELFARRLFKIDQEKTQKLLFWGIRKIRLHKRAHYKNHKTIYRWEVFWCELGENIGSEETKRRPCVIIQNQKGNDKSPTTIIAPITNSTIHLPIAVPLNRGEHSDLTGTIDLGQIRVVSKGRLIGNSVDKLKNGERKKVEEALIKSVGLYGTFNKLQKKYIQKDNYAKSLQNILNQAKKDLNVQTNSDILNAIKKLKP